MSKPIVKIRLLDEVNMVILGLHGDHHKYLYDKYAVFAPGYNFQPKFKLGVWDGRIRYYTSHNKTFLYLIEDILPVIVRWGYSVEIEDLRDSAIITPPNISNDIFSHILHPDTDNPIILRDDQVDGVNALIEHGNGLCIAGTGAGKAQPLYANVLTTTGWKLMGDIRVNDQVITPSGRIASVIDVFPQSKRDIYTITFHDGAQAQACAEHLWTVNLPIRLSKHRTKVATITTADIQAFLTTNHQHGTVGHISIPTIAPVTYTHKPLALNPYVLGVLLGAGTITPNMPLLSCKDKFITDKITSILQEMKEQVTFTDGECNYIYPSSLPLSTSSKDTSPLIRAIGPLGLFNVSKEEVFIPARYKQSSITQRMELLRGLFDINGIIDRIGNIKFVTPSELLAKGIQNIVWSLGGTCIINKNHEYTCTVVFDDPCALFLSKSKIAKCTNIKRLTTPVRRIVSVEKTSFDRAQCILIDDPDHLYITDDFISTHNTFMCAALVTAYDQQGVRSLTIVPDQTLIKQTKGDYALVGLNPGEYSGKLKTLDHDHVVSTWQALKNNPKIIKSFNMLIVDECHGLQGDVLRELVTNQAAVIPYRFGFTGTLPDTESGILQVHTALGPTRHTMLAADLIDMGVLAKLKINILQLEEDLREEYKQFCEECLLTTPPTYAEFKRDYFPDYASEASYRQHNTTRTQWIADYLQSLQDLKKGNTLCLVNSIPFARKLAKLIPNAIVVNGTDVADPTKRQEVYDMFKKSDDLMVIATVHIAGVGLNIKRIFNLVLVDIGKSFIRVMQAVGRGLRKAHDKDFVNVVDISSDFKYSKLHLAKRVKYFQEAKYPYQKHKIAYRQID